jgi:nitrate/nitrite transporter NarK
VTAGRRPSPEPFSRRTTEIFPVRARTTGHGIAAAAGKLGGFLGVFLFPILMAWRGLLAAQAAVAIVSVLGAIVTLTMLPETSGKRLEELSPRQNPHRVDVRTQGRQDGADAD